MELRRLYDTIEYYKTKSGREVDFLVTDMLGQELLIQVAAEMETPATRLRELNALMEAMKESGLRKATIVTLNHEEHLETEAGHIQILPAWLWALLLKDSSLA